MEAVEDIDIGDLWEYNLTELMEDAHYETVDSVVVDTDVEVSA